MPAGATRETMRECGEDSGGRVEGGGEAVLARRCCRSEHVLLEERKETRERMTDRAGREPHAWGLQRLVVHGAGSRDP